MAGEAFEPIIVAFCCNWCAYAGADLAGTSRFEYPTNVRIVRVMCSGRIDPAIVLEVLEKGADGVLIAGCHPGDCHYVEGNYYAELRFRAIRKLLALSGLKPERLRLEWVSASEGRKWAYVVRSFAEELKRLGPSPLRGPKPDERVLLGVRAARLAISGFRLRALIGRERHLVEKGNAYGERMSYEELEGRVLDEAIRAEFERALIMAKLMEKPMSVKELAMELGLDASEALRHIVVLRARRRVELCGVAGTSPLYKAVGEA